MLMSWNKQIDKQKEYKWANEQLVDVDETSEDFVIEPQSAETAEDLSLIILKPTMPR